MLNADEERTMKMQQWKDRERESSQKQKTPEIRHSQKTTRAGHSSCPCSCRSTSTDRESRIWLCPRSCRSIGSSQTSAQSQMAKSCCHAVRERVCSAGLGAIGARMGLAWEAGRCRAPIQSRGGSVTASICGAWEWRGCCRRLLRRFRMQGHAC
jgi:hypothetical protein